MKCEQVYYRGEYDMNCFTINARVWVNRYVNITSDFSDCYPALSSFLELLKRPGRS